MNDTVKIERPLCCRRHEDLGGRIRQDAQGNTVRVKTRAHDAEDDLERSWLERSASMQNGQGG